MRMIKRAGSHELEIRRSRFVCTLARAHGEAEAAEFLAAHRRAHRDATHNCTAYVLGEHGEITRSSDDGEPAGTAGIPMLEVLVRRGLTDTVAVVTRYFGGVKLGAGGLVRAYGQSVAAAVDAVGLVELRPVVTVTVRVDHALAGRFLGDLHGRGPLPSDVRYGAGVEADVAVPVPDLAAFEAWAAEVTAGRARLERGAAGPTPCGVPQGTREPLEGIVMARQQTLPLDRPAAPASEALGVDWQQVEDDLDRRGVALTPPLLSPSECAELIGLYSSATAFRSTVVMERHAFGAGEYRYFADPLEPLVQRLRSELYPPLAQVANRWAERLGEPGFPGDLEGLVEACAKVGQSRPTPLLLRYGAGGYNCLHQDVYGDLTFPLQVAVMLSTPDVDFTGGESVFVEQRPRAQSRPLVARPGLGQGVVFPVRHRPVPSARGHKRVAMRHGVAEVLGGNRYVLGMIFHNAR